MGVGVVFAVDVGVLLQIWSNIELDKAGHIWIGMVGWSRMVTSI